jgi:hydrogenase maturation protease
MSSVATTDPRRVTAAARPGPVSTVVVGIGNPILGDDGIGWRVVEEVERRWAAEPRAVEPPAGEPPAGTEPPPVTFLCVSLGGLSLMERLVGTGRAILVDAVRTGDRPVGTVFAIPLGELVSGVSGHQDNAHDASLPVALAAGRSLGAELPAEITVVGIEALRVEEFGEELSPAVAAARPVAVEAVLAVLRRGSGRPS